MKRSVQAALAAVALLAAGHAAAQITFYAREGFKGRALTVEDRVANLERQGFNNQASSVVVERGRWEVCERPRFEGRCAILTRGRYPTLQKVGLNDAISSVRPVDGKHHARAPEPPPPPRGHEWRRRPNEKLYEVPVSSVRAVVGPPNQRCWIERQQIAEPTAPNSGLGGAIVGGIVGGILGHQVGGGSGKDVATAGGAIAGAVIGQNMSRDSGGSRVVHRDVQRCETVANTRPEYWDVTYHFRGIEHHVQMSAPPGRTITVNGNGEPRE